MIRFDICRSENILFSEKFFIEGERGREEGKRRSEVTLAFA